jgi:hypothetical protein
MREDGGGDMAEQKRDLGDIVLSWSVQEIMNDDLYKGKVIDRSFGWRALGFDYYLNGGCQLERCCFRVLFPFG